MTPLTRNLKLFGLLAICASAIFFFYLIEALKNNNPEHISRYGVVFGVTLFMGGFILGATDSPRKTRLNLGFHYHLITFVVVNTIGIVSFLYSFGLDSGHVMPMIWQFVPWSLGLLVHYYFSKKTIKGVDVKTLFE